MESSAVSQHTRFSSVALALVSLVFLGMLAIRVHAEEITPSPREQIQQLKEERATLFEENKAERASLFEENKAERADWRASSSEERATLIEENMLERRALFDENKEQRIQWRASSSEVLHSAFENRREELKARVEARHAEVDSRREAVKARLAESAQERLGEFVSRMTERMNTALDRLDDVAERVASRIGKIEEVVGTELTEARMALDEATGLIDDARDDVAYLRSLTVEALASDDPKARMEEVREAAKIAKDSIVEVHRALRDAIVLIKESVSNSTKDDGESDTTEE